MKSSSEAEKWQKIQQFFVERFDTEEKVDLDTMLFLIGVQEYGQGPKRFKKDEKINLMHIAVCRLLEPYGYYRFTGKDEEGWPHFEALQSLPYLRPNEQQLLMKKAVIAYFEEHKLIE